MFATVPVYNAGASETGLIQPALIRHVKPHADVSVAGSPASCCEAVFTDTHSIVILLSLSEMTTHLQALTGTVDEYGSLT